MTEIPEHLLQRSKARRAAMGLGGDEAAAPVPAKAEAAATPSEKPQAAAPAPSTAAAPPPPPPTPPWVEAAERRKRVPFWAVPVLVGLLPWAVVYALTLDKPTPKTAGPLVAGATVYAKCSGCHGPGGAGGGAIPALVGSNPVTKAFTQPADQIEWVMLGSEGFKKLGRNTRGDLNHPVNGGMPGFGAGLKPVELLEVVRHTRETLNGETFDPAAWDAVVALGEKYEEEFPGVAEGFKAAVEAWKSDPNAAVG